MAVSFELTAECGTDRKAAEVFLQHFDGFVAVIEDGSRHAARHPGIYDYDGVWWASICPDVQCCGGFVSFDDSREITAVGLQFYDRLRSAPPFRYALIGIEVTGFARSHEDLVDFIEQADNDWCEGLVLTETLWQQVGSPKVFEPFASGYRWRPLIQFPVTWSEWKSYVCILLTAQPFEPFLIRMRDGREYHIEHPSSVLASVGNDFFFTIEEPNGTRNCLDFFFIRSVKLSE